MDAAAILGRARESGAYSLGPQWESWGASAACSAPCSEWTEATLSARAYHCGNMRDRDGAELRARQVRAPARDDWNLGRELAHLRKAHNTLTSDRMGLLSKLKTPQASPVLEPVDNRMSSLAALKTRKIGSPSSRSDSLIEQLEAWKMGDLEDFSLGAPALRGASGGLDADDEEDW